jgi:hypothetical protein
MGHIFLLAQKRSDFVQFLPHPDSSPIKLEKGEKRFKVPSPQGFRGEDNSAYRHFFFIYSNASSSVGNTGITRLP